MRLRSDTTTMLGRFRIKVEGCPPQHPRPRVKPKYETTTISSGATTVTLLVPTWNRIPIFSCANDRTCVTPCMELRSLLPENSYEISPKESHA